MPSFSSKTWLITVNILMLLFMLFLLFLNDFVRQELFRNLQEPGLAAVSTLFIYTGGLTLSVLLVTRAKLSGTNRSLLIFLYFILAKILYGQATELISGDPITIMIISGLFIALIVANTVDFD